MAVPIEDALDDCMSRLAQDGVEACLRAYPEHRDALQPLLRLAAGLQSTVGAAAPPSGARAALRGRVLAAAQARMADRVVVRSLGGGAVTPGRPRLVALEGARAAVPSGRRVPAPWRAAAAVAVLLGVGLGFSAPVAAASLPGDPLYGEKLAGEAVAVALAGDPVATAHTHFQLAERRASEVALLAALDRGQLAPVALDNMAAHTRAALTALDQTNGPQQAALVDQLAQVTNREATAVAAVAPALAEGQGGPAGTSALAQADSGLTAGRALLARLGRGGALTPAAVTSTPHPTESSAATEPPEATAPPEATEPPEATASPRPTHAPGPPQTPPGHQRTPRPDRTPPGQQRTPGPRPDPGDHGTPPVAQQPSPGPDSPPVAAPTPPGPPLTPPGQELTPPGQGGTPPGQEFTPPGQGGTPPGAERTPPGQALTPGPSAGGATGGSNGNATGTGQGKSPGDGGGHGGKP